MRGYIWWGVGALLSSRGMEGNFLVLIGSIGTEPAGLLWQLNVLVCAPRCLIKQCLYYCGEGRTFRNVSSWLRLWTEEEGHWRWWLLPWTEGRLSPSRAGQEGQEGSWAVTHIGLQTIAQKEKHQKAGALNSENQSQSQASGGPQGQTTCGPPVQGGSWHRHGLLASGPETAPVPPSHWYTAASWNTEVKCVWLNLIHTDFSKLEIFLRPIPNFWSVQRNWTQFFHYLATPSNKRILCIQ